MVETRRKSKIPPVRVKADDCVIMAGRRIEGGEVVFPGTPHRVHIGEWVDVVAVQTMREWQALLSLKEGSALALQELCTVLSERVLDWNWTDLEGEPMPKPYRNVEAIRSLSDDELKWLLTATQGETEEQRKNASTP